jgi:chaperonin cofactor prefoldin
MNRVMNAAAALTKSNETLENSVNKSHSDYESIITRLENEKLELISKLQGKKSIYLFETRY